MRNAVLVVAAVLLSTAAWAAAWAKGPPRGVWRALAKPGAKWTLPIVAKDVPDAPDAIVIEVKSVRKVGRADVARIDWSCETDSCQPHELPLQIAITSAGVWFFGDDAGDAEIKTALKKSPAFSDPIKPIKPYSRRDGHFAFAPTGRKDIMCVGLGAEKLPPDEAGCGAGPCTQWLCLDATGIVGAGGFGEGEDFGFKPKNVPG